EGKETGLFTFTLHTPNGAIETLSVGVPGWVNIENAVAASAIALLQGVKEEELKDALASFKGVVRRMDIHVNSPKMVYIDDYAHHPQEIATTISSIREAFPSRKMTAIFQPHLYTRTRDFAPEFAQALSLADRVILLDIYPARELPIEGVTSEIIFDKITATDKVLIKKEELMALLKERVEKGEEDLIVTFGAGNIDRFIDPITELINNYLKK
ncbi:MAG: UDP-N-acetylmuramate--L-alanine ligase, partial [Bacteroidales bacterium]|nr:UDP-N-acetylmuramate--L-alanine ligase [Bacteroidales bacterium]